jgi:YihY family inner membrane protein
MLYAPGSGARKDPGHASSRFLSSRRRSGGVEVVTGRVDRFQRRHSAASFPLAVIYKYFEDFGPYLAALIAYYAFVSLFPLLLLLTTVLGFVLAGDPGLQHQVVHSALRQFPVVGDQLGEPKQLGGGTLGLIVGIIGSLYGGLGVAQAAQYAMNTAWRVPRNNRPNPFKARGRSVVLLATAGLAVIATTALSTLGTAGAGSFGRAVQVVVLAASVAINAAVIVFAFRFATTRRLSTREVAPGAIAAAIAWQLLQSFGIVYVGHVVKTASATNGVFALVLGMLAFIYLTATVIILCVELNVVRVDHLYPRALLTPFTDNVELTYADRRSYANQAEAQRSKGFEDVDVTFDSIPGDADPRTGDGPADTS